MQDGQDVNQVQNGLQTRETRLTTNFRQVNPDGKGYLVLVRSDVVRQMVKWHLRKMDCVAVVVGVAEELNLTLGGGGDG